MDAQEPMRSTLKYLEKFTNYERKGVPKGAGTNSDEGFPLRRMELLMQRLGDPVSRLKVVHVAGTKGKGSVAALLGSSLRRAQLRVGTYTSPHFLTVRERITIDGVPISPEAFAALVAAHRSVLDEMRDLEGVTHFEVLTALAFKHFEEEGVDIAIMEAGLGGARDATNVIPPQSLLLAVITAIHEEHLEALGGSLEAIVHAKCGIIKEGRPVSFRA
ncbi:Mur ligase family protein [Klebsormidium nitens]|uniref:Mur ligase family protein n=1 Tax=Klebsormidium nitens TaxID=105231 RepID=A0A1Y1I7I3_KLENI|nr:Mur ligase family protein [Klebsormidium nitens]|eukprot:GAQ85892.1 Mur ligase family protein [Klebsormidium nitens]